MKRVALAVLDTVLIGIWSFLVLFVLGAAAVFFLMPAKWQATMTTQLVFELSCMVFCWLSTTRFLSYVEQTQWVFPVLNSVIFTCYMWISQSGNKTWIHQLATASAASLIVVLIYAPLYKWVRPHIRIKWGTKASRQAQKIQREQALRSMALQGMIKMKE